MTLTRLALTAIITLPILAAGVIGFILGRYKIEVKKVQITGSTVDRFKQRLDANGKPIEPPNLRIGEFEERPRPVARMVVDDPIVNQLLAERDSLRERVRELESQLGDTLKAMDGE